MDSVKIYEQMQEDREKHYGGSYGDKGYYKWRCKKTNLKSFFIPFTITFVVLGCLFGWDIIFMIIPLTIALSVAFIFMMIGYSRNVRRAKEYGIPDDDVTVQEEKLKIKTGVAAGVVGAVRDYKNIKDGVDYIGNPDSWKEMK